MQIPIYAYTKYVTHLCNNDILLRQETHVS